METRRRFLQYFSGLGLGSTLLPGVLWSRVRETQVTSVTAQMIEGALAVAGLQLGPEAVASMVRGVNRALDRYQAMREIPIPDDVAPATYFSPVVAPGYQGLSLSGRF